MTIASFGDISTLTTLWGGCSVRILILLLAVNALVRPVSAADFWRSAKTLNQGQLHFSVSAYQKKLVPTNFKSGVQSSSFKRQFSWADFEKNSNQTVRSFSKKFRSEKGISSDSTIATYKYALKGEVTTLAPTWTYGFHKNWVLGVRVPIQNTSYDSQTNVDVEAVVSNTSDKNINIKSLKNSIRKMGRSQQAANQQAAISGEYGHTKLGDIEFLNKIQVVSKRKIEVAILGTVRFPSSGAEDPQEGMYLADDQGQFDVALGTLWSYQYRHNIAVHGGVAFTSQLPDRRTFLWQEDVNRGEAVVKDSVQRDLGDYLTFDIQSEFSLSSEIAISLGVQLEKRDADRYEVQGSRQTIYTDHEDKSRGQVGLNYEITNSSSQRQQRKTLAQLMVSKDFNASEDLSDPLAELAVQWFY